MGKRLWDLAKSRIEIATILPGHRHKVTVTVQKRKRSMKFTAPGQALHCSRLIHIFRPQHSPLSRDREVAQVWHHL